MQTFFKKSKIWTSVAKAAGLSRADLAEKIGVNQSALTHWGKGESNPSIDLLASQTSIIEVMVVDNKATKK
jgi:DNA-binding XRE family transcriptional regulator